MRAYKLQIKFVLHMQVIRHCGMLYHQEIAKDLHQWRRYLCLFDQVGNTHTATWWTYPDLIKIFLFYNNLYIYNPFKSYITHHVSSLFGLTQHHA